MSASASALASIDMQAITLRPAPRREPPFDDPSGRPAPRLRLVGPHDRPLPFDNPRSGRRPARELPLRSELPDPARWGHRLLVGLTESAAGRRPIQQLSALLTPSVAYGLGQDFELANQSQQRHWIAAARVNRVRACRPTERAAELSATVTVSNRVRAIAIRIEEHRGSWRCTKLQLG